MSDIFQGAKVRPEGLIKNLEQRFFEPSDIFLWGQNWRRSVQLQVIRIIRKTFQFTRTFVTKP